jgi:hypothetical protein
LIGGTVLVVLVAAAFGQMLDRLYPNGGILVFAAYFVVHVGALLGIWTAALRWADA